MFRKRGEVTDVNKKLNTYKGVTHEHIVYLSVLDHVLAIYDEHVRHRV